MSTIACALLFAVSSLFGRGMSPQLDDANSPDSPASCPNSQQTSTGYASVMNPVFSAVQRPPNIYHLATWHAEAAVETEFCVYLGGTEDNHEQVSVSWDAPGLTIVESSFHQTGWEFGGVCTIAAGNKPGSYEVTVSVDDGHKPSVSTMTFRVID